jgi:hypothetical protein
MSDAEQNLETEVVESKEDQDYKALYEKTLSDLDKVVAKKDELYKETKKAKAAREQAATEVQRIAEDQAKKNGEFEKLWQTASKEKEQLLQQLKDIKNGSRQDRLNSASMKIATELADGDNAELLSEFVKKNLENMADDDGSLSEDVVKAVVSEFKNNGKFKSLLRASKASGGGAPGNMKGSGAKTTLTRAEFERLNPQKQFDFITNVRNGSAELTDN